MHVFVTGAGGFTGARLVPLLLERGHQVTAATGHTRGRLPTSLDSDPRLDVRLGDLVSDISPPPNIDAVVHAAARSPAPEHGPAQMVNDNVVATRTVVDGAVLAGAKVFVYLSSLSVYGRVSSPVVDETTPIVDPDTYGLTKRIGEELVAEKADQYRSVAIRLPGVLGPNPVRNWMAHVLAEAQGDRDIPVFNPDAAFNNAVHVDDVCALIAGALEREWSGADVVTVAADGATTVRGAVETVIKALGSASRIVERTSARTSFTVSSERAKERFGFATRDIQSLLQDYALENTTP